MPTICEHQSLADAEKDFLEFKPLQRTIDFPDGLLLNPEAKKFDQRYFFTWNSESYSNKPSYTASYMIGAQRFGKEELIIKPKMPNIDFMKMFAVCLNSGLDSEHFSKIYSIRLDQEPIRTDESFVAALTPLLIVHFLMIMKRIISKGLRSDYIFKNENCKKVRGKIDINSNERKNIINQRYEFVYCKYVERSTNTPENRLLKKTLLFCRQLLFRIKNNDYYPQIIQQLNICLSCFDNIDAQIEMYEIKNTKTNKLYKDYDNAIKLAKLILRRFDYSITNVESKKSETPVFWIDMPLLYEHYVYGLLHQTYGSQIKYQEQGKFGLTPDFLHTGEKIIMDTKYMPQLKENNLTADIVGQLAGYSRIKSFANILKTKEDTIIPCLILYPTEQPEAKVFTFDKSSPLIQKANKSEGIIEFYKMAVPLPMMKQ